MRLVFDDGPCELTGRILDTLRAARVKATFAVVGQQVVDHKELTVRIVNEGHQVANHTMSHARLTDLSDSEILIELTGCRMALAELGVATTLVRPPFNAWDERVEEVAGRAGFTLLKGSSIGDYLYDNVDELVQAARGYRDFVGLHDTHPTTADALSAILALDERVAA